MKWMTRGEPARNRIDGHLVLESDLAHLSPCRYEHINPYGKYAFELS